MPRRTLSWQNSSGSVIRVGQALHDARANSKLCELQSVHYGAKIPYAFVRFPPADLRGLGFARLRAVAERVLTLLLLLLFLGEIFALGAGRLDFALAARLALWALLAAFLGDVLAALLLSTLLFLAASCGAVSAKSSLRSVK